MVLLWRAIEYEKVEEFKMLLGGRSYLVVVLATMPVFIVGYHSDNEIVNLLAAQMLVPSTQ